MWADDFHHVVRVMPDRRHREVDYKSYEGTAEELAATLEHGWLFEPEASAVAVVANQQRRRTCFRSNSFSALQITIKPAITPFGARLNHHRPSDGVSRSLGVALSGAFHPLFSWVRVGGLARLPCYRSRQPALATYVTEGRREEFRGARRISRSDGAR